MRDKPSFNKAQMTRDPPTVWDAWLVLACAFFLLVPKVNIIQISGQTSGIRADDLFLMLVSPYLLIRVRDALEPIAAVRLYLIFIGLAFVSAVWHVNSNDWKLVLYPLRLLEYATFLIFGALCTSRRLLVAIALLIILLNTGAALGQMFLGWGGFPYSRYAQEVGARAIGLTAGPWEMAAVVNIALAYLAYSWGQRPEQIARFLSIYMVALVCMILSGSRVGLVVNTLIVASYFMTQSVKPWNKVLGIGAVLAISALTFLTVPNSLVERSRALVEQGNLERTQQIGRRDGCQSGGAGETIDFAVVDDGKHDPSWGVRAQKWATAFCIFNQTPGNYLLGVGPGYFGPALDGGFFRVLVEHGSIGLLFLLSSLIGGDSAFRSYRLFAIVFAAHMVFIDIYLSYKFISLLLFMLGAMHGSHNGEKAKANAPVH